jgi:hypothetical protein
MAPSTPDKIRENRLRAAAERQGLALRKSRRRDPLALDYGRYSLIDTNNNVVVAESADLDVIERRLQDGRR